MTRPETRRRLPRWWPAPILVALAAAAGVAMRMRPVEVAVAPVSAGPVTEEAVGTGTIESEAEVSVAFTLPGRIAKIEVQEGQRVQVGTRGFRGTARRPSPGVCEHRRPATGGRPDSGRDSPKGDP